jgi:hypothetical protein
MIPEKSLRSDGKVRRQSGAWMKGWNQVFPGCRSAVDKEFSQWRVAFASG